MEKLLDEINKKEITERFYALTVIFNKIAMDATYIQKQVIVDWLKTQIDELQNQQDSLRP